MTVGRRVSWRCRRGAAPLAAAALLLALAGCGPTGRAPTTRYGGYAPPGPPGDPWGPYVKEAATRFHVPERWIREVMRQESGGREYLNGAPVTSDAGAMGLMQVMPATYGVLRDRYGLESDAYDPHNNILAGTAYIKEMYERYGAPGFLAAYNAGPARLDDYLAGTGSLPNETVNYLASIAPRLGDELPMTGPLAVFAEPEGGAPPVRFASVNTPVPPPTTQTLRRPEGCFYDPDAAYDPAAPCRAAPVGGTLPPPVPIDAPSTPMAAPLAAAASCPHDPDLAYDPSGPCLPAGTPPALAVARRMTTANLVATPQTWGEDGAGAGFASREPPPATPEPAAQATRPVRPALFSAARAEPKLGQPPVSAWGIQVGAFANPADAERAVSVARTVQPGLLEAARATIGSTTRFGGQVLYRARLVGLTARSALQACGTLARSGWQCMAVPPGG